MESSTLSACERYFLERFPAATLRGAVDRAVNSILHDARSADPAQEFVIPVDVERIARSRGIQIEFSTDDTPTITPHGQLVPKNDGWIIRIQERLRDVSKRYAIAHELGHTLFFLRGEEGPRHAVGVSAGKEWLSEERLCNSIARTLLIPGEQVRPLFQRQRTLAAGELLRIIDSLANLLGVSAPVLLWRLSEVETGLRTSFILLCLRVREKNSMDREMRLRVTSWYSLVPGGEFWVPKRSARNLGLTSADLLYEKWRTTLSGDGTRIGGTFVIDDEEEIVDRIDRCRETTERVNLSVQRRGRWKKTNVTMRVASCLYAPEGLGERSVHVVTILEPLPDSFR